jgi:two-component system, OmpR family, sensor histidine kinase MtrB
VTDSPIEPASSSRRRGPRVGLRARITIAFAFGAMLLSALLAGTAFVLVRQNLLEERESTVESQVFSDAQTIKQFLPQLESSPTTKVLELISPKNPWLLITPQGTVASTVELAREDIPQSLRDLVASGQAGTIRYGGNGGARLAIGVPLAGLGAQYYEVVDVQDLAHTLRTLVLSLLGGSVVSTLVSAAVGWWVSRRTLRPLADVSQAAEAIAGGRLDTRLEAENDPDLGGLASSFNHMAQALQERIERDARFASDVSHELRSPLMTLSASVDVLESRCDELPDRAQAAVRLLTVEVARFSQLVEDLLEISRYDAGAVRLELNEVRLAEFVMQAVQAASHGTSVAVELDSELAGVVVQADKRRLSRVIANLLDNARKYGQGDTTVSLTRVEDRVQIAVSDEGPGVPADERKLIFDRFARGGGAGRRGSGEGVGLGLSLVAEHVRLHGGQVWVDDRVDHQPGARFVVELPVLPS